MTYIKKEDDGSLKSFNFKAPSDVDETTKEVLFPVHETIEAEAAYLESITLPVKQMVTKADITWGLQAALNLDIDEQVTAGAILQLKITNNGDWDALWYAGTGFSDFSSGSNTMVRTGSTQMVTFIYDGTAFCPVFTLSEVWSALQSIYERLSALENPPES